MKHILLLLATGIFTIMSFSSAQAGEKRPSYTISVTQNGKSLGNIVIELFPEVAPLHVANFDSLVTAGFYDGTAFHRVVPDFVIQGGGINSKDSEKPRELWGVSDSSQHRVPAEFNSIKHIRGIISAARSKDINSASSQFFICLNDAPNLDGQYTAYGQVLSGMDVVDTIVELPRDDRNNPMDRVEMTIKKNQ